VAERDGIWSRGGANIEELPDPFAPGETTAELPAGQTEQPRRRLWPIVLYGFSGLLLLTLVWLVLTAPLASLVTKLLERGRSPGESFET